MTRFRSIILPFVVTFVFSVGAPDAHADSFATATAVVDWSQLSFSGIAVTFLDQFPYRMTSSVFTSPADSDRVPPSGQLSLPNWSDAFASTDVASYGPVGLNFGLRRRR